MQEMQFPSLVQEDPLEEEMETHCSILQRKPGDYSLQGWKESDVTERLSTA